MNVKETKFNVDRLVDLISEDVINVYFGRQRDGHEFRIKKLTEKRNSFFEPDKSILS